MKRLWSMVRLPSVTAALALVMGLLLLACTPTPTPSSPVCGDGVCELGEVPDTCREDCPPGVCPDGSECTSNEMCETLYSPFHYCNPYRCTCQACLAETDNCRTDADCHALTGDPDTYCQYPYCECYPVCPDDSPCWGLPPGYACTMVSGPAGTCQDCMCCPADPECTSDAQCETLHDEFWYCNPHTCDCFACPTDSDNCRTDAECQEALGDSTATCNRALCDCVPGGPGPPEPIPLCGNAVCDSILGETCATCEADCGPCPPGEPAVCGDGVCAPMSLGENCYVCPEDCGPCCGDGVCDPVFGEDCRTCSADCGLCASGGEDKGEEGPEGKQYFDVFDCVRLQENQWMYRHAWAFVDEQGNPYDPEYVGDPVYINEWVPFCPGDIEPDEPPEQGPQQPQPQPCDPKTDPNCNP